MKKRGWIILIFIILLIIGAAQDDEKSNSDKKTKPTEKKISEDRKKEENTPVEAKEKIVKWNVKDENALENGNIKKAIKLLVGKSKISNEAIEISSLDAYKRPWNYYGKIVAISGMVAFAEDYPPESDLNRKFGTDTASNITIITEEGVIVSLLSPISSIHINRDNIAVLYGYIVGRGELVKNNQGGIETGLVMIGTQVYN